jgi:hypothetical protein
MYKVKLSPEEALETIKLRMKYDSSKTLTENVDVVNEQGLAGNASSGQASGGQTYGRTYNYDTGTKWYDVIEKWAKKQSNKFKARDDQFWYYTDKDIWNFKKDGNFIYSYESGKTEKGKWVVNGTEIKITTEDGDEFNSKTGQWKKTTSDSNNSSTGSTSTAATSTSSIPAELKDVKNFQDWLDKNHPGWHDKYNTLNKDTSKGYGKFGPRTSKAWSTSSYKDEYLKGTNTPTVTPTPTGNPDLEVDDKEASLDQPF